MQKAELELCVTLNTSLLIVNKQGNIVEANPAFCQLTQYTFHELKGKNLSPLLYPKDTLRSISTFRKLKFEKDQILDWQLRIVRKDQSLLPVNVRSVLLELETQTIVANFIEIRYSKRKPSVGLDSSLIMQKLLDTQPEQIACLDKDFRLVAFNRNFATEFPSIHGNAPKIQDSIFQYIGEANHTRWIDYFHEVLTGKPVNQPEVVYCSSKKYKLNIEPILTGGQVVGILQKTQRVQEGKNLDCKYLYDTAPCGILLLDRGNHILHCNQKFIALSGYSLEELLGVKLHEQFIHPSYRNVHLDRVEKLNELHIESEQFEEKRKNKKGQYNYFGILSKAVYSDEGKYLYRLEMITNINLEKRHTHQLIELNKSKDEILGVVAHDLRNPISQIQGLMEVLRFELGNALTPEIVKILNLVKQAGSNANNIINDLTALNIIENPQSSEEKIETVRFKDFIRELLPIYVSWAKNTKNISLKYSLPPDQIILKINKKKISRVLDNLISNAIKYSFEGKSIILTTQRKDDQLIISVKDEGMGIPGALQPILFDKFTKAGRPGTKGEHSTGLGMFISKKIIEAHQGRIWFESEEHKGTVFHVSLPIKYSMKSLL
ncbi:ATP-binding protein [Rapidithrix thailandica]|uniref:histidine kinase n=1 Tax=Rapidithrix thailandica TaxID=413964 RepID=A0AAW9SC27_9BACT